MQAPHSLNLAGVAFAKDSRKIDTPSTFTLKKSPAGKVPVPSSELIAANRTSTLIEVCGGRLFRSA